MLYPNFIALKYHENYQSVIMSQLKSKQLAIIGQW